MATIGTETNGHRRILFVAADGSRKTVRLGKCSQRDAEQVCRHVEALVAATINGLPVPRETAVWVRGIGHKLHDRLARAGLVEARAGVETVKLAQFIDGYIAQRQDLKPSTLTVLVQARVWLVRFLGEDRMLDAVTVGDADGYRAHMFASGLAKATIAKRCRYARHFFEVAKRRGLIEANPFSHIKGAVKGNVERRVFVPGDVVAKVLDAAPDPQWKLLIALARWGGLRVPSEALALTWHDVDFAGKRFVVRASKTEHHADGGIRVVPMFPELVPHFQAVFDDAEEGAVYVVSRYRYTSVNLRTQFQRYIERAGVKPWPKLWQNLRASRATELADAFPSHVCAAWLGHTEKVADAFYRSVTDAHFERAINPAQNPAQQLHADDCKASHDEGPGSEKPAICGAFRGIAIGCDNPNKNLLGDTGLEPVTSSL
ncbi:MAG: tyrosine-type recombinase/integrase [Phycisphaerae bacterium]